MMKLMCGKNLKGNLNLNIDNEGNMVLIKAHISPRDHPFFTNEKK